MAGFAADGAVPPPAGGSSATGASASRPAPVLLSMVGSSAAGSGCGSEPSSRLPSSGDDRLAAARFGMPAVGGMPGSAGGGWSRRPSRSRRHHRHRPFHRGGCERLDGQHHLPRRLGGALRAVGPKLRERIRGWAGGGRPGEVRRRHQCHRRCQAAVRREPAAAGAAGSVVATSARFGMGAGAISPTSRARKELPAVADPSVIDGPAVGVGDEGAGTISMASTDEQPPCQPFLVGFDEDSRPTSARAIQSYRQERTRTGNSCRARMTG